MEPQKSSYWKFAAGFLAIIFVAVASAITVFYFQFRSKQTSAPKPPQGDEIVITKLPNGDQLVENKTQGYKVTVPEGWYVEKGLSTGTTFYPDYNLRTKNNQPTCKIEISKLNSGTNQTLNDWLAGYLNNDPTVRVVEYKKEYTTIDGYEAVRWSGSFDKIDATLIFIKKLTNIFELAPSSLVFDQDVYKKCVAAMDDTTKTISL